MSAVASAGIKTWAVFKLPKKKNKAWELQKPIIAWVLAESGELQPHVWSNEDKKCVCATDAPNFLRLEWED